MGLPAFTGSTMGHLGHGAGPRTAFSTVSFPVASASLARISLALSSLRHELRRLLRSCSRLDLLGQTALRVLVVGLGGAGSFDVVLGSVLHDLRIEKQRLVLASILASARLRRWLIAQVSTRLAKFFTGLVVLFRKLVLQQ